MQLYHVDGRFRAYDIAYFATANMVAWAKTRALETSPSVLDDPIKQEACHIVYNWFSFTHSLTSFFASAYYFITDPLCCDSANQSSEDRGQTEEDTSKDGGQTEAEIEEEITR